jgi:DNA-binding transcriptional MerR regulator/methylmalonyl-CoA mutase cobalamin-binding subunit
MSIRREEPLFNLKAVVQQTGLKPDTLRAWERRYGLPSPARSGGKHRLYTQRDIEVLRWLVSRQRKGLSISRAVDLWRQMEAGGRDTLPMPLPPSSIAEPRVGSGMLDRLRQEWLAACLAYDGRRAEQAAAQAFALYPVETVCLELLQRALAEVGDLWQQGTAAVQQEHLASELAIRQVEALLMAAPPATRPGQILAACPPQEYHTFGLLLLTLLLRRRGWAVLYLGANVPAEQLEATVADVRADLVILAALRLPSAAALLETARALQGRASIGYGGGVFNALPAIRSRIPGHFLGESLAAAADVVESLMSAPRPAPGGGPVPAEAHTALEHFRERQGPIEAKMAQAAGAIGLSAGQMAHANEEFALHLEAALALGDVALLDTDIASVEQRLAQENMPAGTLGRYLSAYCQVAEEELDERGELILAWLRRVAGR